METSKYMKLREAVDLLLEIVQEEEKRRILPKDYLKLVDAVKEVSKEDADYLLNEATDLEGFEPSNSLAGSFYWELTPQGAVHWAQLGQKIHPKYR